MMKPTIEDNQSWSLHLLNNPPTTTQPSNTKPNDYIHKQQNNLNNVPLRRRTTTIRLTDKKKIENTLKSIYDYSGIKKNTVHGIVIDAGSTGSTLHIYEYEPRILTTKADVEAALAGKKLSFPGSKSRWSEKLRPGLGSFADIEDDDVLYQSVMAYLKPLINFAIAALHDKTDSFEDFPIYLKATAGLRVLSPQSRGRLINVVRDIFSNKTLCPFQFEHDNARVISGEEEGIYGWAGANFLLGTLLSDTEGTGTVETPRLTYGTLDLGGASAEISYFVKGDGDIMADLFKLQIGAAKHWNVYTHSFLYYGYNEAFNRLAARVVEDVGEPRFSGYYNPCLPGGSSLPFESNIHFNLNGFESHKITVNESINAEEYYATIINDQNIGNYDQCDALVGKLLHKDANSWCNFAYGDECSFAGTYQPTLPLSDENQIEQNSTNTTQMDFLAFSGFFKVWDFLGLEPRSNLYELQEGARRICNLSYQDLKAYNHQKEKPYADDDVIYYCFRATYAFQLLHNGYGFRMEDYITALDVVDGHKVGWALGSMLYEVNTLPWIEGSPYESIDIDATENISIVGLVVFGVLVLIFSLFRLRSPSVKKKRNYTSFLDCDDVMESTPLKLGLF